MAEDYGVSLKITADTSDLERVPQKVEAVSARVAETKAKSEVEVEEVREPAAPVEHPAETVPVTEQREPAAPVEHAPETVKVTERREPAAPVEHPAETVAVTEQREPAAPVEHPAETVAVTEQREPAAPVEHPAETVEVREKRIVEPARGGDIPVAAERTETVKVNVGQPEPVKVKVEQDPDPLKIKVELPDPAEIEAAIPKKDFHVDVQPRLDPSKLQAIPPIQVPVEAETPPPVTVEAKAEKVRVEVDDEEAKKRIEALTAKEGIKRIRVVTEGGELAARTGGKEIFELEVDGEAAKKTIADLKADARFKVTADTREAVGNFNAMRAAMAVLHGNFAGLSMELAKLSNGAGMLKTIGVSGFLAIGGAIMGVVSLARSLRDLFATMFNTNTVGRDISSLSSSLLDIKNEAENFASAMDDARKAAERTSEAIEKEVAALGRVAKAQSEINRQRELAGAASDDERAAINTRYDRQANDIDATTAQQSDEVKRKSIEDEIERLKKEIQQSDVTIAAYNQTARAARQRADFYRGPNAGTVFGGMVDTADSIVSGIASTKTDREKAEAASTVATNAQNAADDEIERQAELKEKLEQKLHELKMANLDAEARKAEQQAKAEKTKTEEAARAKQREERQATEQGKFERERGKSAADAEFEDRMRAEQRKANAPGATESDRSASENAQIAMLREREEAATKALADAKAALDAELKKPSAERNEAAMSRAREDIRAADSTATDARRRREDLEASAETRRANVAQDYFGNLAQQIDASRPKNRLTAMGLGSGAPGDSRIAAEQANNVKLLVSISRQLLAATRDNKPDNVAVYAP